MRINLNDLPQEIRGRNPGLFTDMEPHIIHESARKNASQKVHTPCSIHIHSIRHRLADSDGVSGKAAIDGIILAGILPDDSPEVVRSVTYSQAKGKEEKIIITIEGQ